jgi:hypothetical protein
MIRRVLAALTIASLSAAVIEAQSPAATGAGGADAVEATFVGCLATAADGFVLKNARAAPSGRRTGGSNSAKASTPIGGGPSTLPLRRETAGSNSPKASTPIGSATTPLDRPRTGGTVTPKGSVPLRAATERAFSLEMDAGQLAPYVNQMVEVTGERPIGSKPTIRVDNVRPVASGCVQ